MDVNSVLLTGIADNRHQASLVRALCELIKSIRIQARRVQAHCVPNAKVQLAREAANMLLDG